MRIINRIVLIIGFLGFCFISQTTVFAAVVAPNYTLIPSPSQNQIDYSGGTSGSGITPKSIALVVVICIIVALTIYFWPKITETIINKPMTAIRWWVGVMLGIFGALVLVAFGGSLVFKSKPNSGSHSGSNGSSNSNPNTMVANKYNNGTYTATGSYSSPGGQEALTLSLTLNNNVVVDSTVTTGANDSTSTSYQNLFIASYKDLIIGKSINNIKLSTVAGSSLTSQGFNDALSQIEQQAKA